MLSDWLLQVMWLRSTNQSALLHFVYDVSSCKKSYEFNSYPALVTQSKRHYREVGFKKTLFYFNPRQSFQFKASPFHMCAAKIISNFNGLNYIIVLRSALTKSFNFRSKLLMVFSLPAVKFVSTVLSATERILTTCEANVTITVSPFLDHLFLLRKQSQMLLK